MPIFNMVNYGEGTQDYKVEVHDSINFTRNVVSVETELTSVDFMFLAANSIKHYNDEKIANLVFYSKKPICLGYYQYTTSGNTIEVAGGGFRSISTYAPKITNGIMTFTSSEVNFYKELEYTLVLIGN